MFDYNFFQDATKVKKTIRPSMIIATILCSTLLIGMAGIVTWTYLEKSTLQMSLNQTQDQIRSIEKNDDISRIMEKEALYMELESISNNIEAANQMIMQENQVTENMLALISDTIPIDMNLEQLEVVDGQIFLTGKAYTRPAIAEFAHNLRLADSIEDVFISTIEINEDEVRDYTFSMQVLMGGDPQ